MTNALIKSYTIYKKRSIAVNQTTSLGSHDTVVIINQQSLEFREDMNKPDYSKSRTADL